MHKYISVLLCCLLMSVILIPSAYSLWRKDLNIMGTVEILADKKGNGHGYGQGHGNQVPEDLDPLENSAGESITKEADADKSEDAKGTDEVVGVEETDGTGEAAKTEVEKEEKAEETKNEREN